MQSIFYDYNVFKMKSIIAAMGFTLLNIKFRVIPAADLLVIMGISIIVDFITGVIKSRLAGTAITSTGYRKTIIKFVQYGGALGCGILLKYVALRNPELVSIMPYVGFLNNALLVFIIFIEVTSILENLDAMDTGTPFSRHIIRPLLRLLTFSIRNNPLKSTKNEDTEKA